MGWFLLAWSIVSLISGVVGIRWHKELDNAIKNYQDVEYIDYLISGYSYLVAPIGVIGVATSIVIIICG